MKIWKEYGSEHSMSLVMIGQFKTEMEASDIEHKLEILKDELRPFIDADDDRNYFGSDVLQILQKYEVHSLSPNELTQFLYDYWIERKGNKVILSTDESEVSAFFKLMIDQKARVEVYSSHDWDDENMEQ